MTAICKMNPPSGSRRHAGHGGEARWILRDGTRDLHERAEQALDDDALREIHAYVRMLRANLNMTETVLQAVEHSLPRGLIAGLEQDRARLGSDLVDLGTTCRPRAAAVDITGRAAAFGALYVCEGARLGGRVQAAQVKQRLGLTADYGAAYLNGDGSDAGARWRGFVATLNREVAGLDDLRQALLAARAIFTIIIMSYEES